MKGAETIARQAGAALVAACRISGVDPEAVFEDGEGGGKTRVLAAATCVDRLGWDKPFAARVFRINRKRLTPSGLIIAKVDHGDMAIVADAIAAANRVCPRPVSDRVVSMARRQVANGADVAFVADCFDVEPTALARALQPEGVAA
jgi:hypothetical protein